MFKFALIAICDSFGAVAASTYAFVAASVVPPLVHKTTTLFNPLAQSPYMRHWFTLTIVFAVLIFACGCTGTTTDPVVPTPTATAGASAATPTPDVQDYTFTQTITYSNENGTTVIAKNKLAKTATIDCIMRVAPPDGLNKTKYYEFAAGVTANLFRMALFNETALAEFEAQVAEWNAQEWAVEDDSPPEQAETAPGENPLDGYTVQRATVRLTERGTGTGIAEIVITGPDNEDLAITYL